MSLLINDEFRELIPSLSDSEYAELEQSILAEGCREALAVWNGSGKLPRGGTSTPQARPFHKEA